MKGFNGELIRKKIKTKHFVDTEIELDIYLDLDDKNGQFRMKRVGYTNDDKNEVYLDGIKKCPNAENGWIPHFVFGHRGGQEIQIAKINPKYYGQNLDLGW